LDAILTNSASDSACIFVMTRAADYMMLADSSGEVMTSKNHGTPLTYA
jgi:hypothetical protein